MEGSQARRRLDAAETFWKWIELSPFKSWDQFHDSKDGYYFTRYTHRQVKADPADLGERLWNQKLDAWVDDATQGLNLPLGWKLVWSADGDSIDRTWELTLQVEEG